MPPTPCTLAKFLRCLTVFLQDGMTPAYIAAENGHVEVLALLRDAGADLNAPAKVKEAQPQHHPSPFLCLPPLYTPYTKFLGFTASHCLSTEWRDTSLHRC